MSRYRSPFDGPHAVVDGPQEPPPEPTDELPALRDVRGTHVDLPGAPAHRTPRANSADPWAERRERDDRAERRRERIEERQWREDCQQARRHRACILRELSDARTSLLDAEERNGALANASRGLSTGAATAGFGYMALGAGARKGGIQAHGVAAVMALALGAAVMRGTEVHEQEVARRRQRVRDLERELAEWRLPPRPPR